MRRIQSYLVRIHKWMRTNKQQRVRRQKMGEKRSRPPLPRRGRATEWPFRPANYFSGALVLSAWACAVAQGEGGVGGDNGASLDSGGTTGGGNSSVGTGGRTLATGGANAATGSMTSTGGTPTGGSVGTGGQSMTGGSSTGGLSTGGSSTGGVATGGVAAGGTGGAMTGGTGGSSYEGDCAGKPSHAEWASSSGSTGDKVVFECEVSQSECADLDLYVDYLFECVDDHVNNCRSQTPEGGDSWMVIGSCAELADSSMGGMGGMGGAQ